MVTSPCANDGSSLELIYYGESGDESDSKKSVRSPGSLWASRSGPSKRRLAYTTREVSSITLFDGDEPDGSSPTSIHTHSQVRDVNDYDDDASHHHYSDTNYLCWYQSEGS